MQLSNVLSDFPDYAIIQTQLRQTAFLVAQTLLLSTSNRESSCLSFLCRKFLTHPISWKYEAGSKQVQIRVSCLCQIQCLFWTDPSCVSQQSSLLENSSAGCKKLKWLEKTELLDALTEGSLSMSFLSFGNCQFGRGGMWIKDRCITETGSVLCRSSLKTNISCVCLEKNQKIRKNNTLPRTLCWKLSQNHRLDSDLWHSSEMKVINNWTGTNSLPHWLPETQDKTAVHWIQKNGGCI